MALTSKAVLVKGFDGNAPVFYFKQFIEVDTLPTVGVKNVGYAVPTSATEFSYHYYDGSVWRGIAAGGAASVHNDLTGRGAADQHPQSAITGLSTALGLKVDKVTGKGLSANDYTDTEKTKLGNIADGAEVNVNADWSSTSGDSEILNKPTIIAQTDVEITIAVADWSAGTTAVKTVAGVTATSTQLYSMIKVNQDLWGGFNLCANAQATDQITFVSDSTPTSDIVMKILIQKPL